MRHILEKVMSMQHSFEEFSEKQRRVELKSVGNCVAKTVLVESANQISLEELCKTQYSLKYFSMSCRPSGRLENMGTYQLWYIFRKSLCQAKWKWAQHFYENSIQDNISIHDQRYNPPYSEQESARIKVQCSAKFCDVRIHDKLFKDHCVARKFNKEKVCTMDAMVLFKELFLRSWEMNLGEARDTSREPAGNDLFSMNVECQFSWSTS